MITTAVFDLDGTLLDTVPDLTQAMSHAMVRMGYAPVTADQSRAYIGNGIKMFAKRAISGSYETDTPDDKADEAVKYFKEFYAQHLTDGTRPYPGMAELLRRLKSDGIRAAVLSNKYDAASKYIINCFFPDVFDCVLGESEICPRKPDPAGFLLICKKLGCDPGSAVMIGDSPADVTVAKNAGARSISVCWGYRSEEILKGSGAECFAHTPEELYEVISGL
ncbi:MAG: HAD-IA family hydrolase [Clostridia bacterium]|nr:HAD-IA family hydrolase [Clostridia bacterium]